MFLQRDRVLHAFKAIPNTCVNHDCLKLDEIRLLTVLTFVRFLLDIIDAVLILGGQSILFEEKHVNSAFIKNGY